METDARKIALAIRNARVQPVSYTATLRRMVDAAYAARTAR